MERRQETETIEVRERPAVRVVSFREEGEDSVMRADKASVQWLRRNGFIGEHRINLLMSCSFPEDERITYAVHIAPPDENVPSQEDLYRMNWLEGGLYACITTRAYGSMSGVLKRIYHWLHINPGYEPDGNRSWYSYYIPCLGDNSGEVSDFERSVYVECCVPVVIRG